MVIREPRNRNPFKAIGSWVDRTNDENKKFFRGMTLLLLGFLLATGATFGTAYLYENYTIATQAAIAVAVGTVITVYVRWLVKD